MKRRFKFFTVTILCALLSVFVAACAVEGDPANTSDKLKPFLDAYAKISEAVTVEQDIDVMSSVGTITVYSRERVYTKSGEEYAVSQTEKRLNDLYEEQPFSVTEDEFTLPAAQFSPSLGIKEEYFTEYSAGADKLTAKVKSGSEKSVLGIEEFTELSNMELAINLSGGKIASVSVVGDILSGQTSYPLLVEITFGY